ncbi:alpha/beta fold hydrolase [Alicyclobacillus sp. SO9]|uniref:alpha/beta fold hydrolase n=1 Tax=Alicyclobacillus sp. SO9 TaxID=2665646 RepID=UPI0018E8E008|nr:alpha/beta hydrolase [Alicyclobacillus sp. SO9]QQE81312.1 alpha/beta fold hydrolase [Alicyclobacillus sp. SO9]
MVETHRGSFEVFTRGDGKPLCITHLYSEFNETGDNLAEKFVPERRVFLVNLKEAGNSPQAVSDDELSMKSAVEDLEAIRSALGFDSWDFAGLSTGGMLGLLYVVTRGTSLKSLVVVGSAASREYSSTKECIYHTEHPKFHRMQELIESLKAPDLLSDKRAELTIERTKLSLHIPERYHEYFSGDASKRIAAKRLDYFGAHDHPEFDVRSQLPAVTVPTLIICGRHDVQCPLWCSVEMNELIAGSKLVIFEHSNHYPFLEEAEKFAAEVHTFLSAVH